jgi:hypothetical protein
MKGFGNHVTPIKGPMENHSTHLPMSPYNRGGLEKGFDD